MTDCVGYFGYHFIYLIGTHGPSLVKKKKASVQAFHPCLRIIYFLYLYYLYFMHVPKCVYARHLHTWYL